MAPHLLAVGITTTQIQRNMINENTRHDVAETLEDTLARLCHVRMQVKAAEMSYMMNKYDFEERREAADAQALDAIIEQVRQIRLHI